MLDFLYSEEQTKPSTVTEVESSDTSEFKILSDIEHLLLRPNQYIGSINRESKTAWVMGNHTEVEYVEGLIKCCNELIDNAVDNALRTNFEFANRIEISVTSNTFRVSDNGTGIPQEDVVLLNGDVVPRPVACWTQMKAGTSFEENRKTIGANGVGSVCANAFSERFHGETCDGKTEMNVVCTNNLRTIDISTRRTKKRGTTVTIFPDFNRFGVSGFDDSAVSVITDRVAALAVAYPEIVFIFNGTKQENKFKKYATMYADEQIVIEQDGMSLMVSTSNLGFRHNSFVNGVHTRDGGVHVNVVVDKLSDEIIPMIKRKYKLEVTKPRLKECMTIVLFLREFNNPQFDSQTKVKLTNTVGEINKHIGIIDYAKIAKKIVSTDELIMPVIELALARKLAAEQANATKAEKAAKQARIAKHIKANGLTNPDIKTTLFLTEGDCVDENREVFTFYGTKKIKDISIGDEVLTHNNRFRKVVSYSPSIKKGIKINGEIYSEEHRLYVYDTQTSTFDFVRANELVKGRHKLIQNKLVEVGMFSRIQSVVEKTDTDMKLTRHGFVSSSSHEFIVFDGDELTLVPFSDIVVGDLVII